MPGKPDRLARQVGLADEQRLQPRRALPGCVVVDGLLWIYYGCCDTSIGLATVPLDELVEHIFATSRKK